MAKAALNIQNLRVRLPGQTPESARRLGAAVARHLAKTELAGQVDHKIGSLKVRLTSSDGLSTEALAMRIAAAVRRQLP